MNFAYRHKDQGFSAYPGISALIPKDTPGACHKEASPQAPSRTERSREAAKGPTYSLGQVKGSKAGGQLQLGLDKKAPGKRSGKHVTVLQKGPCCWGLLELSRWIFLHVFMARKPAIRQGQQDSAHEPCELVLPVQVNVLGAESPEL